MASAKQSSKHRAVGGLSDLLVRNHVAKKIFQDLVDSSWASSSLGGNPTTTHRVGAIHDQDKMYRGMNYMIGATVPIAPSNQ